MNAAEKLADPGFGNYMLNGLQEITLPEPPSYRPQTLGWKILVVIGLILLVLWSIQRYQIWHRNRYRRAALKQLKELEQHSQDLSNRVEVLKELPVLLKRTALAAYPREQVASLHGNEWLTFLDNTYPGNDFTQGNGQLLAQLAYQPPQAIAQLPAETFTDLIATTRRWITRHN